MKGVKPDHIVFSVYTSVHERVTGLEVVPSIKVVPSTDYPGAEDSISFPLPMVEVPPVAIDPSWAFLGEEDVIIVYGDHGARAGGGRCSEGDLAAEEIVRRAPEALSDVRGYVMTCFLDQVNSPVQSWLASQLARSARSATASRQVVRDLT